MVIERGGMNGGEDAPTVGIQGYVDMVAEKNADSSHDFLKDPIRLVAEGDWLTADGRTLGADNGMGVDAALALLDMPVSSGVALPPLECLFTVQEEVGLRGAFGMDASMIKGPTMLNLDRGNGIVLLVRVLESLRDVVPARIVGVKGGGKYNAIPRGASAIVLLPTGEPAAGDSAREAIARVLAELKSEFVSKETALFGRLEGTEEVGSAATERGDEAGHRRCLGEDGTGRLLPLLPPGVLKMSHDIKDLVETSSNLASIASVTDDVTEGGSRQGNKMFKIVCSARSALGSALAQVLRQIRTAAKVARDALCCILDGEEPVIAALHATLECGVIEDKIDGMDMVSFGPTMEGCHSPGERVKIKTVKAFWHLVVAILEVLANPGSH